MRSNPTSYLAAAALAAAAVAPQSRADVFSLTPVADAFVTSGQPTNNYGGAGSLGVSAPGLPQGEFQSVLRFDTTTAVSQLNTTYGAGNWTIQSITLQLTAAAPNNAIFNAQAAGQFAVRWMSNDSWVEGTGTPAAPTTAGITFATLPGFLSAGDLALGAFSFGGGTTGTNTYALSLAAGFQSDVAAGGLVSLRLLAADTAVSYLSNSRTFGTASARPALIINAVPAPASLGVLLAAGLGAARRQRRPS